MMIVFQTLLRQIVLIFIDDILVYCPDWNSHIVHLQQVLTLLQEHSLHVNMRKCEFERKNL